MKFKTYISDPYLITFEDREYLKLSFEYIGPHEVEVLGDPINVAQWATRTGSTELTDAEFSKLLEEYTAASVQPASTT